MIQRHVLLSAACLLGASAVAMAAAPKFEIRLVVTCMPGMPSFVLPQKSAPPEHICLSTDLVMDEKDIVRVRADVEPDTGAYVAVMTYGKDAQARMAATTRANAGHRMAILFNDNVLMAPMIAVPIMDGSLKVVGSPEDIAALMAAFHDGPGPT